MSAFSGGRYSRRTALKFGGVAGLAGAGLAACSHAPSAKGGGGGDGGTVTVYWHPGHAYDAYANVIKKFEKDRKVSVNWQKFQWPDLQTKLQADISAGTVPDLCEQPSGDSAIPLALTDDLLPLDPYIAKDGKQMGFPDDWQDQSVVPWQHGGKTYGVQLHLAASQIYYNKKTFSAAGVEPPTTWDELLTVGAKLTKDGHYALALNQDSSYSEPWILQNGAVFYDPKSKQALMPHDAALQSMQFQHDLIYKYKYSPAPTVSSDYSGPQKLLSAGRAAMILTGPWDILPIKQAGGVELGIAPPLKGKERKTILAGSGMVIPAKAKNPDLAWDLIKRLTTVEVELQVTKEATQSMPRKSWATRPEVKSDPVINAIAEGLPYGVGWGRTVAPTGKGPQLGDAYKTFYQSVAISGTAPEKAMQKFLRDAQKALG